jgi:hypothetical protein
MRNRKGMCKRCVLSQDSEPGQPRWCTKYRSFCQWVARNCPGPVERRHLTLFAPDKSGDSTTAPVLSQSEYSPRRNHER